MKRYSDAATPGRLLVDLIPICDYSLRTTNSPEWIIVKYIPSWFPGASFKRIAAADRQLAGDTFGRLLQMVQERMVRSFFPYCMKFTPSVYQADGDARYSLVASFIQERGGQRSNKEEEFIMFTAADL
jgi:hypothetical protein